MDIASGGMEFALDREVTIQDVACARDELAAALAQSTRLTLRIGDIGGSDLTLVQLIESARKTAARENRTLLLAEPASGALRQLLERGGFILSASPEDRRFWLQEETQ